jgi:hypothetical protein
MKLYSVEWNLILHRSKCQHKKICILYLQMKINLTKVVEKKKDGKSSTTNNTHNITIIST